jgi:transcriptional regulator with XRE-family HTH domain
MCCHGWRNSLRSQASRTEFGEEQMRSLGMRLRELREARSWSLRRLALESSISIAAIQKIESGETNPSLLTVLALAEALSEPVDRLVAASLANSAASNFTHGVLPDTSGELKAVASSARLGSRLMVIAARRSMTPPGPEHPRFFFVLDGSLRFNFSDGTSETLQTGDSMHLAAGQSVRCSNMLQRRSRLLYVLDRRDQPDRKPEYA